MLLDNDVVVLKQNVLIEPLFNRWPVTLPMIAPAPSAMLVRNSHIKIMQSYINSPDLHMAAVKDPKLRGGPFMDFQTDRSEDVSHLLDKALTNQAHLIRFAEAIEQLDNMLATEADGFSLEPLYARVPDGLQGFVELVYDLNNHPSIKFKEGLLYKSPVYDRERQSTSLSLIHDDLRPFVLSTPRLDDEIMVEIHLPFDHEDYDELFRMKYRPATFGSIRERLGVSAENIENFSHLFEACESNHQCEKYAGDDVRVRYFGHACLLFETKNTSVLVDPLVSYKYPTDIERFTYEDLPEVIDYILITHGHLDHMVLETLLQIRHRVKHIIVPKTNKGFLGEPSLKLLLTHLGFTGVLEMDDLETEHVEGGAITCLPFLGEHHDLDIQGKTGYWLDLNGKQFMVLADSANLDPPLYQHLRKYLGRPDTIFLGMECDGAPLNWFYGHMLTRPIARDKSRSRQGSGSDEQQASALVDAMECKNVYIYAMGLESWFSHILSLNCDEESKQIIESNRFLSNSVHKGITSERLYAKKELHF
jgi:L-ascorbate metabolism protein UlaG (beta-lactamase superfamily)